MKHDNLNGADYIEKNGLERVTSIDVLLLMQNVGEDKLYSSSATLPTLRPDASGRHGFHLKFVQRS